MKPRETLEAEQICSSVLFLKITVLLKYSYFQFQKSTVTHMWSLKLNECILNFNMHMCVHLITVQVVQKRLHEDTMAHSQPVCLRTHTSPLEMSFIIFFTVYRVCIFWPQTRCVSCVLVESSVIRSALIAGMWQQYNRAVLEPED